MRIKKKTVCPTIQKKKEKYMKYGTIYGKKNTALKPTMVWDSEFNGNAGKFICEYYKTQRRRDDDYVL
jgi:hypothetical protein